MQADLWKKVEALYQAALAQPPEERAAFLLQACPDDPQLRGEVQSLLDQQADFFLESAPLSAIKALSAGAKLGNFEIVELLGRGGMGEVWRARDARLKRDVAIKVLPAGLTRYPDRIARFEREARAAATLTHPNICVIHEVGAHEGQPFIVMEFLEGHTLKHRIGAHPLKTDTLLDWAIQIAGGLEAAHQTDDRGPPDDPRRGGRDSALHVARAGARGRTGCALGPVQLRRGAVRDGDGEGGVDWRDDCRSSRGYSGPGTVAGQRRESTDSARAGWDYWQGAGEGPRPALSACGGHARGSETGETRSGFVCCAGSP